MNKFWKAAVLSIAAAAVVLPTFGSAQARDRHHHHNDALAAGAVGLVAGTLIGSAIASQPRYSERVYIDPEPEYYEPRPVYRARPVYRPVVVENYGLEPWTPAWYRYCSQRYRSFDPDSGTFIGYDGRSRFCTAG